MAQRAPVLLAAPDPQGKQKNVLAALGIDAFTPEVKSLETSKVIELCDRLYSEFDTDDGKLCRSLVNGRNEELHTGALAFDSYPFSSWMLKYYGTISHLCGILEIELSEMIGDDEAGLAHAALSSRKEGLESSVKSKGCLT